MTLDLNANTLIWSCPHFAAVTASTLLGRLSTRFVSVSVGISAYSLCEAFVTSDTDVGQEGLHSSPKGDGWG